MKANVVLATKQLGDTYSTNSAEQLIHPLLNFGMLSVGAIHFEPLVYSISPYCKRSGRFEDFYLFFVCQIKVLLGLCCTIQSLFLATNHLISANATNVMLSYKHVWHTNVQNIITCSYVLGFHSIQRNTVTVECCEIQYSPIPSLTTRL